MNCFVIMPFGEDFDDVYRAIKHAVESASLSEGGRCFRLDESRPAGRITDRLIGELRSSTICVADVSETNPNVMWELVFVMDLGTPAILLTQDLSSLPFDIRDIQTIEYQRNRLLASLETPLKQVVSDTLCNIQSNGNKLAESNQQSIAIGELLKEVKQLKEIISDVASGFRMSELKSGTDSEINSMVGHWYEVERESHAYTKMVQDELVTPCCFTNNDSLTGIYYGWRRVGEYWFARYKWIYADISGFSFFKQDSIDSLVGAWWSSTHEDKNIQHPPEFEDVSAKWLRLKDEKIPNWANEVFKEVENEGLSSYISKLGIK